MSNVLIGAPDSGTGHNKGRCSMYIAHQNISFYAITVTSWYKGLFLMYKFSCFGGLPSNISSIIKKIKK